MNQKEEYKLIEAIKNRDVELAMSLVEDGLGVHYQEDWPEKGMQAIHVSSFEKTFFPVVELLLKNGANPNVVELDDGWTPLHCAVSPEIINVLVRYGADVNALNNDNCTPLLLKCSNDRADCVKELLRYNPSLNDVSSNGGATPLLRAVCSKSCMVEWLLEAGADVNICDDKGRNAFWTATSLKKHDLMESLLKHGAEFDVADNFGETPLASACDLGDIISAKWLLELGADPYKQDCNGDDSFAIAKQNGDTEIISLLDKCR